MNQSEKRLFLIQSLLKERPEYRDIDIPADWDGRDIYLHLAGAKSGVYVYINGQEVGYSEDSKNPAEFLINNYVKPGKNVLTVKIFRWSTGSWNVRTSGA